MTHTTLPRVADHPAPASLWRGLLDDAAVFPPGNAPWREAVAKHAEHRAAWYADVIGPLLLPVGTVAELAQEPPESPLDLVVIGRPGTDLKDVRAALETARGIANVTPTAAEIPYAEGWREALTWGVPLAVEVPASGDIEAAVRDIADAGGDTRAKLRTGATPAIPVPTREQLALFLVACAVHGVPAKLAGGLHHAVQTGDEYGFLAVLLAAAHAAVNPLQAGEVARRLAEADPATLADGIGALTDTQVHATRSLLTAYGCCQVLDPLTDLVSLGLVKEGSL